MAFRYGIFKNIISTIFFNKPTFTFHRVVQRMIVPKSKIGEKIGEYFITSCIWHVAMCEKLAARMGMATDDYLIYKDVNVDLVGVKYIDSITNMAIAFYSPSYAFKRACNKMDKLNNSLFTKSKLKTLYDYLSPALVHKLMSTQRFYEYQILTPGAKYPIFGRNPEYNLDSKPLLYSYIAYCKQILPYTSARFLPVVNYPIISTQDQQMVATNFVKTWNKICRTTPSLKDYALNFQKEEPEADSTIEVTECNLNK